MESKKLPVLWLDRELIHDANWPLYDYAICCTTRPHQSCREPYIPVARVRELIAVYDEVGDYSADCFVRALEELIDDVEDHEG